MRNFHNLRDHLKFAAAALPAANSLSELLIGDGAFAVSAPALRLHTPHPTRVQPLDRGSRRQFLIDARIIRNHRKLLKTNNGVPF